MRCLPPTQLQTLMNEMSIPPCQVDVIPLLANLNESISRVFNHIPIHVERAAQSPEWRHSEEQTGGSYRLWLKGRKPRAPEIIPPEQQT